MRLIKIQAISQNHLPRYLLYAVILMLCALVVALPFHDPGNLMRSNQTEKFFLFAKILGSLMILTGLLALFTRRPSDHIRITWPDILLFAYIAYVSVNRFVVAHLDGFTLKYYQLLALAVLYLIVRQIPKEYQGYLLYSMLVSGILQAVYGNLQLFDRYPSKHALFNITGGFFNPGPYAGYLAMILPMALALWLEHKNHKVSTGIKLIPDALPTIRFFSNLRTLPALLSRIGGMFRKSEFLKQLMSVTVKYISVIAVATILVVLPATRSRAAWLAVVISALFVLIRYYGPAAIFGKYLKTTVRKVLAGVVVFLVSFGFITGIYYLKKDSADGRLLIWKITAGMIADRPLTGHGYEKYQAHYMSYQADYFAHNPDSEASYVADNILYPFNEYLKAACELGFTGLVLVISVLVIILVDKTGRRKSHPKPYPLPPVAGMVSLCVFSFFSYPAEILPILINMVILLAVTAGYHGYTIKAVPYRYIIPAGVILIIVLAFKPVKNLYTAYSTWDEGYRIYQMGAYDESIASFQESYDRLKTNGEFMVMYGKALSMAGRHPQAIRILIKAQDFLKNTILYTALGDSYKALGQINKAEKTYLKAYYMIPSRFYPKYLLAKLYDETGQSEKAVVTAAELIHKKEKLNSTAIDEIRVEMERIIKNNKIKRQPSQVHGRAIE